MQLCSQPTESVESEFLEIKSWCKDEKELTEKVSEASTCIANANGGYVLVGVGDGRVKFSPCPHKNVTASWLTARIQDNTYPCVECQTIDISDIVREFTGKCVNAFLIEVPKTKSTSGHLTSKGISKVRVGRECQTRFAAEDDRTKPIVPHASPGDLSEASVEWAYSHSHHSGSASNSAIRDFLWQARILEPRTHNECPGVTLAGLLLFGSESILEEHVPFVETVIISPAGTIRFRKNIVDSVRELCWSNEAVIPRYCPALPLPTVRELLVNAYIHRCYRTNSPVTIEVSPGLFEIQNPGELPFGLNVNNLIHGVPIYRNFLLADTARLIKICDKVGQGIDLVYRTVLSGGFDFPFFDSRDNRFTARISLTGSREFREFARIRAQALTQLDEIVVLRMLWSKEPAAMSDLCTAMQRPMDFGRNVLESMLTKNMIESVPDAANHFRLVPSLRNDIKHIFKAPQLDLFGRVIAS